MKAQLAKASLGRILLHALCAWRDHHYRWHWQGILREFGQQAGFSRDSNHHASQFARGEADAALIRRLRISLSPASVHSRFPADSKS